MSPIASLPARHCFLVVLALLLAWAPGCGRKKPARDTSVEDVDDPADDRDDASPDPTEDPLPDPLGDSDVIDLDGEDVDASDVDDEEVITTGCGNGLREPALGEVCDDGNRRREACGTTDPAACLADCSGLMAECGDGSPDGREQCDDGDGDDTNGCTNSCTTNGYTIGSPCACTAGCSTLDFTAGTIVGCDGAASYADSTRSLACVRSSRDVSHGIDVYAAAGFCTLLAVGCSGTLCFMVPTTGDVDAFACPDGFVVLTEERVMMGMTITARSCHPACDTDADCRWNAEEDSSIIWAGACGEYACVPLGEGGASICADPRNST